MEIVKRDNGYGIKLNRTYVDKDGFRKRAVLSLKKVVLLGLSTSGLSLAIATLTPMAMEAIEFASDEHKIESLREDADYIAELKDDIIEIDGNVVSVSDEINDLADMKAELLEAKRIGAANVDELNEQVLQQEEEIRDMSLDILKQKAEPFFEENEDANLEVYMTSKYGEPTTFMQQVDRDMNRLTQRVDIVDEKKVESPFADAITDGDSIERVVDQMAKFIPSEFQEVDEHTIAQKK